MSRDMTERIPISTLADLASLDDSEIIAGYFDGRENFRCGDNRSLSYWHGWRNGRCDGGHAKSDWAQQKLAAEAVAAMRREGASLQ